MMMATYKCITTTRKTNFTVHDNIQESKRINLHLNLSSKSYLCTEDDFVAKANGRGCLCDGRANRPEKPKKLLTQVDSFNVSM